MLYKYNYVLPYTKHDGLEPLIISHANNFHLVTSDGRPILDAQCGNICCNLGYSQHSISQSIYIQSTNLPFSRSNNSTVSELGVKYSSRLAQYFTNHNKFFFGSSGSDAVETAIRLSYITRVTQKSNKNKIITVMNSYHGSTWLTGAISDMGGIGQHLPDWPDNIKITSPFGNDGSQTIDDILKLNPNEISSFVIEPFTYLAGVKETSKEFWTFLNKWCKDNDVHLILDESASGFFKTGTPFYYEQVNIDPTFIILSKSITAGYAPLSAVAIHDDIWNTIENQWIVHGWTNSGSIIGLAAANEAMNIFEKKDFDNTEMVSDFLRWVTEEQEVTATRQVGNFFAFEMKSRKWRKDVGVRFANVCLKHGLQLTSFKYDAIARGLIPINADEKYFDELKQKVKLVLNDSELIRKSAQE